MKSYVYSMMRLICSLMMGVYIALELAENNNNSSWISAIVVLVGFIAFMVCFAGEGLYGFKERCSLGSKVENR